MRFESPVQFLKKHADAEIYIKRDDKIPFSFGGNKVRIAAELIADMKRRGFDSVISYGSPGSNMNRAVAHMAMLYDIPCRVIIKMDMPEENKSAAWSKAYTDTLKQQNADDHIPLNEKFVLSSSAVVTYCNAYNVRETVENVIAEEKSLGRRPYYIYGNSMGQGNRTALMMASFREYGEIRRFEKESGTAFDHIFLAAGTGATIAGLTAGERTEITVESRALLKTPLIHGISVARTADREREVILDDLYSFNPAVMDPDNDGFYITDEYLCGGYGKYNDGIMSCIERMLLEHAVPLDPTYTGKAFYGMEQEIEKTGISGSCLFIHTGGYPLFADMISGT
mgnify:CR=1 FL=1